MNGEYGKWHTRGLQVRGCGNVVFAESIRERPPLLMQEGEDSRYVKTAVTLKHWDAYSLEDSDGFTRYNFNAVVSPRVAGQAIFNWHPLPLPLVVRFRSLPCRIRTFPHSVPLSSMVMRVESCAGA